jgi:hypothetical protein
MKENLHFYQSTSHKCKYDELKLMVVFQIWIRLDPDLFNQIQILQGAMAVWGANFHDCILIGIQVVDLKSLILLYITQHSSTDCSFERQIFKRKKGLANLSLGLIYYSIASSQPKSRDTIS